MMARMAAFAINDMVLKLVAQLYPLGEVISVRGIIATLLVGSFVIATGQCLGSCAGSSASSCSPRTACDGLAMLLFITRSFTCRSPNSPRSTSSRRC